MPEPNQFALTTEQETELSDELRKLLHRWARHIAGVEQDTPLYQLDAATRHRVELARLAVANVAAEDVENVDTSAAYDAAAHGSSYGEIATAAGMANRHNARHRYPRAREAMRARKWMQHNRASWLAALRVLSALADKIHPADTTDRIHFTPLRKNLHERDADVADVDLVNFLTSADWLTRDASTDDGDARAAVDRVRALIVDWRESLRHRDPLDDE